MAEAIERAADGAVRVSGPLTFETVEEVRAAARAVLAPLPRRGESVIIDLGSVKHADSAGLALLAGWWRAARREGGRIHFRGAPSALRSIAGLCGVERHLFG